MNKPLRSLHSLSRSIALCCGFAALSLPVAAEDIDIYAGVSNGDIPNVLLILDNSANWGSSIPGAPCYYKNNGVVATPPVGPIPSVEQGRKIAIEKCALYNVIDSLPTRDSGGPDNDANFNIAIMLLNESPIGGGYPRRAFTPLTTNNKVILKQLISGFRRVAADQSNPSDQSNNAEFARTLHEAHLYYKGLAPLEGTKGSKWHAPAVTAGKYNSPSLGSCARNHIIFIANGSPQGEVSNQVRALLAAAGGNTSQLTYPTSVVSNPDQANWSDEYARFLRGLDVSGNEGDQGIVTHGVAVTGASSDGLYPNYIRAIAAAGGGTYNSASTADQLEIALGKVFNEIQAVNSVFSSASLPVSASARGTYLNQVFLGTFRPDASAKPRWQGNLKQYQFGLDALGVLQLVDASGTNPAISATTGFIATDAVSFWTSSSTFWSNQLLGTPPSASDSPDGEVVEKGAAAQRLRTVYPTSQATRKVLTCVSCAANTELGTVANALTTEFKSTNTLITETALNVPLTSRSDLIDWVRGTNNAGDEVGPTTTPATTVRPSIHGDVLHSRPAVVNYGGTTGVVVFYGGNDGMLHAVDGNTTEAGAGNELWSFVPQEMFPKLNRLRANTPSVKLSTTVDTTATPRDYFVDGPIGVYQKFNADLSINRVIIYVGMRRGGRVLYAFDVTDPTSPIYLWKKSNSDLTELGQTWSEPRVARIRGNTNPVLIFGGGYDAAAEDSATPGTTTMGHRVYVLDAVTGALLKAFTTNRSVAADVTLVDSDPAPDGFIDRAYAVDLGGAVYRIDFEKPDGLDDGDAIDVSPSDWTIYTFADLSGGTSTGRKFFFAPDVIVTRNFTALMFGSGDREKPLTSTNQDHFFQLFDRNLSDVVPGGYTPTAFSDLSAVTPASSSTGLGCYVTLDTGEKVVNAASSIAGNTFFGTNRPTSALPASNVCTANLGVARSYAMPLFCVAPTYSLLTGGGLPPGPVTGIVTVTATDGTPRKVPFCIGCPNPKNSSVEGVKVNPVINKPRQRRYWYKETER